MSKAGVMKTPISEVAKRHPSDARTSGPSPFDSDSDSESKATPSSHNQSKGRNASSTSSSLYTPSPNLRGRYQDNFRDSGGLENQSVQELEKYAVYKAEETTEKINGCVRIAEDIREDATRTLVTLHQQGEQITRTHTTAANIEYDLSMGEKLLGSLGGLFSKKWKPKKGRSISGPQIIEDNGFSRKGNHLEQREKLGLVRPKVQSDPQRHSAPSNAMDQIEVEKSEQDDALSDLSNLLGELKEMAVDMGSEIGRQNRALEPLHDDVEELNFRVRGANQRTRHLLGK